VPPEGGARLSGALSRGYFPTPRMSALAAGSGSRPFSVFSRSTEHGKSRPSRGGSRLCSRLGDPARHIGDFTRWKEHDAYQKALDRLLRDLRVEKA
jgi:hypothetical protein